MRRWALGGMMIGPIDTHASHFDRLLDQSCLQVGRQVDYIEVSHQSIRHLMAQWQDWTGSPVPTPRTARAELTASLRAEGDLTEGQIQDFVDRILPDSDLPLENQLRGASERLILLAVPWFPLWLGYTDWLLDWCRSRGYADVIFLARDSLLLYTAARYSPLTTDGDLRLSMVDLPRAALDASALPTHLAATVTAQGPTMLVDTGCYGTVATRLAEHLNAVDVAVTFFASRNPRIFGYLNYLMGRHYLGEPRSAPGGRGPADFVIYGCDVLESLPKPYAIGIDEWGITRRPADLVSFVLALRLCVEISRRAAQRPATVDKAGTAADRLYRAFRRNEHTGLLDFSAPTNLPQPAALKRLGLHSLAPQNEVFGTLAGYRSPHVSYPRARSPQSPRSHVV